MVELLKTVLFSCVLVSVLVSSHAQNCATYSFTTTNNIYATCTNLPVLNSFLHWTYHQSNHTVDIAYRHTGVDSTQWVAWALNLNGTGMAGAQSLVAYTNSSRVAAYTSPLPGYSTQLAPGALSFGVPTISAEHISSQMIIYATLVLPSGQTTFNQLWQVGPVSGGTPGQHGSASENLNSRGTVDFSTGQTTSDSGGNSRQRKQNIHGVLNVVSWGILLPLGAVAARYLKVFKSADPAWFYIHVACQTSAYIVGVAGWATGLKLRSDYPGVEYNRHRNIGIALFCLGTIQIFALLLRPKKDHKYRIYWNMYHYAVGYTVIILSIVNIFKGFDILQPEEKWRRAYIGVLIFIGINAALLEAFTWYVVLKRKKSGSDKHPRVANGSNGVNGYADTRSEQTV